MSTIEDKFAQYLNTIQDTTAAAFLKAAVAAIPEDQKRQFIIDNCPVIPAPAQKVQVTAYDDESGAAWKLMFGDETVEDGFDSTADAEMWARDNGYIPVSEEPESYTVTMCRTGYGFAYIDVMARSPEEAEELAMDEAGDHSYSEKASEYKADGANKF
jgi:hypothetical protein